MSQQQLMDDEEQQFLARKRLHEMARRLQKQFHTRLAAAYLRNAGCPLQEAVKILASRKRNS